MKSICYALGFGAAALSFFTATGAPAQTAKQDEKTKVSPAVTQAGQLVKITDTERAWVAKAREGYPLNVCLTSDEKLGSMGENAEFVYRAAGKPDRLVTLCCDGCADDFMKEPAKYLAKLDAAAKNKAPSNKKTGAKQHHRHH